MWTLASVLSSHRLRHWRRRLFLSAIRVLSTATHLGQIFINVGSVGAGAGSPGVGVPQRLTATTTTQTRRTVMLNRVADVDLTYSNPAAVCVASICVAYFKQAVSSSRALGVTGCVASHGSQKQSVQKGKIQISMEVQDLTRDSSVFTKYSDCTGSSLCD
jgi:hypothetical protein